MLGNDGNGHFNGWQVAIGLKGKQTSVDIGVDQVFRNRIMRYPAPPALRE